MQVSETLNEGLKRKLEMSIPASELNEKLDAKLNELKDQVNIKGFRPGKVPFAHLKKVYGRSVMGDVIQETVNTAVQSSLTERDEKAAAQPEIDFGEDEAVLNEVFEGNKDLDFSVAYEILPNVELMDFKKIKIERPIVEADEKEVDEQFNAVIDQNRPFEAKDGKAADGDRVTMSFLGKVDGEPFEGGQSDSTPLVLGSGQFIPGFEEQLVGLKKGDKKVVEVKFPEEYRAEDLAGKDATFDVEVLEVETPAKVEIDDEFAKTLGLESIAQLREMITDQLKGQLDGLTRRRVKREVLDALDEAHKFDVPEQLVDLEFKGIWDRVMHDIEHHGRSFEDEGTTEEKAREEYRAIADRRVRLGLVIAEIGNKNEIEVTEEEHQKALIAEVQKYPGQEQQVYDYFRNNQQALAGLRAPIFEDKVVDYVIELAEVTDKKVTKEELIKLVEESEEEDLEPHNHD
ncbi:trigger factor [Maritalea myrionectae]|uniref:Trigger factor n=1 Tax=Maritalea myrionectae TaxID=454601 RepID=A0A2R4MES6_9HYPH|nr:trigger factor [Maritalea myrionectae]AVX04548.1 trigger factor [Maritalea myrionectae]